VLKRLHYFSVVLLATRLFAAGPVQEFHLGPVRELVPGVELYHVSDPTLLAPEAPISIWLLRLDPSRVQLRSSLANDEIMGTETVENMARRHGALAAVNAGFFLPNGDPAGVLAIQGQLVSDTRRARGAVGILSEPAGTRLVFARLRATIDLLIDPDRRMITVPIDGVDTTRARGRLMLFTPAYHAHTDTAPGGREWILRGSPLRVNGAARTLGKSPIPRDGFVLSFGATTTPPPLKRLRAGTRVVLQTKYEPLEGAPADWSQAHDIVGGAGLLLRAGRVVEDWGVEQFNEGFAGNRHPRTLIGTASDGRMWLVTVDGRQPSLSAGMRLEELRALAQRLDLRDALNLDGGGSTTMWVQGRVMNSPSDVTGPRKVSDALLVFAVPEAPGRARERFP
jgi:hypothetical protein